MLHAFFSLTFVYSYSYHILLGEILNTNDAGLSKFERMALGLALRAVVMSVVVDNATLMNEKRSFLLKVCVEYGARSHNHNKSKVKVKETSVVVNNSLMKSTLKEQTWPDDDSDKEYVDNAPVEEVESKLKIYSEKEFKKCFNTWIELARGINWAKEFPKLESPNDSADILEHLFQEDMGK